MASGIELNTITGEFFHPDITTDAELLSHTQRVDNPHQVTSAQVGAISTDLIGAANGIAPLNASGKVSLGYLHVLDEDDMVSNSENHLATQQSIRAFVEASVSGIDGGTIVSNTDVDVGTEVVDEFATALGRAAHWDIAVYNGLNIRVGRLAAGWNSNDDVSFAETGTIDLGSTSDITLSVDISGGNLRLLATALSNNWIIVASRRIL